MVLSPDEMITTNKNEGLKSGKVEYQNFAPYFQKIVEQAVAAGDQSDLKQLGQGLEVGEVISVWKNHEGRIIIQVLCENYSVMAELITEGSLLPPGVDVVVKFVGLAKTEADKDQVVPKYFEVV